MTVLATARLRGFAWLQLASRAAIVESTAMRRPAGEKA
jgi:hypothetical protein